MKNPSHSQSRKGFTLVELLVVIAIIAVLAAAGFSVGTSAMNRARKLSAQSAATSVSTAIDQFYTEYSSLPNVTGNLTTNSVEGVKLLNILAGSETGATIENERKVRFLTLNEAKNGTRDGLVYNSAGNQITGLFDPWGRPYYIVLDNGLGGDTEAYDERLNIAPGNGIPPVTLNGRRAAVYSLGVKNAGDANSKTLVKTW